jgi:MFS family permease
MVAALAVPNFRRYISGQAVSLVGTWVETVAQALLVLRLTHSGAILGLTTAARFAPVLALSPYAGLLVDRFPGRRILLITQAGLGLVSAALGVLVLTGHIDIWGVVVLALAFGTLSAVDNPARQAFVSELVGAPLVRDAVTLNSTSVNVARVLGPTVAAALVATVGIGWCFVANAGSFLFVIASLVFLNTRQLHPVRPEPRLPGQVRQGLRYAAGIPAIARPLLMMALVGTFTFEFEVSLPLLAEKTFHGNATTYSLLLGSLGAGAVAGGLYAAQAARTGVATLTRISVALRPDHGPARGHANRLVRDDRLRPGRGGQPLVPHHRERHRPAGRRSRLPGTGDGAMVDRPGRQHAHRLAHHRGAQRCLQPSVRHPARSRGLRGGRRSRTLARPRRASPKDRKDPKDPEDRPHGSLIQTDRWAGSSAACTALASSSRTVPRSTASCRRAANAATIWSAL